MTRLAHTLAKSLLLGAVAGAVFIGAGGRIAMRLIGLHYGLPTGATLGGTSEVLAAGAIIGAAAAPAYFLLRSRVRPSILLGVAFGGALFLLLVIVPPPAARSAAAGLPGSLFVALAAFLPPFASYGAALELLARGRAAGPRRSTSSEVAR